MSSPCIYMTTGERTTDFVTFPIFALPLTSPLRSDAWNTILNYNFFSNIPTDYVKVSILIDRRLMNVRRLRFDYITAFRFDNRLLNPYYDMVSYSFGNHLHHFVSWVRRNSINWSILNLRFHVRQWSSSNYIYVDERDFKLHHPCNNRLEKFWYANMVHYWYRYPNWQHSSAQTKKETQVLIFYLWFRSLEKYNEPPSYLYIIDKSISELNCFNCFIYDFIY